MRDALRPEEEKRLQARLARLEAAPPEAPLLRAREAEQRRKAPTLIDVELAPAQREIIDLPVDRSVLVLGEAGHGKTTVALHRLARLWKAAPTTVRAAVIVPTEGLSRLISPLLRRLGVDIAATTYEEWALVQARSAFKDLPRRVSEDGTIGVSRIKRDPALRLALRELAAKAAGRIDDDLDVRGTRSKAHAKRADLQHLFGDRELIRRVVAASREPVPERFMDELFEHTRIQFSKPAEVEHAHVDRERLAAVDGQSLDHGTSTGDVRTIDSEDVAVMFEIDRFRAERLGAPATQPELYDLILLDEAQELAPLELALIGRSLAPGGTLIVAGDEAQQVDPTITFDGWSKVMLDLGVSDYHSVTLPVGYRCPPEVAGVAKRSLDPAFGSEHVPQVVQLEELEMLVRLSLDLNRIVDNDRLASAALICRSSLTARRLARWLQPLVPCRLVFDGHFIGRGVQITTIDQVRGLEFDYVVIPDADVETYPDDRSSRRNLYLAITRARHQVVFACAGTPSPILR